jgi:hypothetical protein
LDACDFELHKIVTSPSKPSEKLLLLANEKSKKARMERG